MEPENGRSVRNPLPLRRLQNLPKLLIFNDLRTISLVFNWGPFGSPYK